MPQECNVLKCFSCGTFQVHLVKKQKKWECKMCGEKQSFIRHYGKGSGKDCQVHVMKLNKLKGETEYLAEMKTLEFPPGKTDKNCAENDLAISKDISSKWTKFIDENEASEDEHYYDDYYKVENKEIATNFLTNQYTELKMKNENSQNINKNEIPVFNNTSFCEANKNSDTSAVNHEVYITENDSEEHQDNNFQILTSNKGDNGDNELSESNYNNSVMNSFKKTSNIFSSNPNDLDEIINISF